MRRLWSERGSVSIEVAGMIPMMLLLVLVLVQGYFAVSVPSALQTAARDGARAQALGQPVRPAVRASLPSWITLESVSSCGGENCVRVRGRIPVGIKPFKIDTVTVSREASLPGGRAWR